MGSLSPAKFVAPLGRRFPRFLIFLLFWIALLDFPQEVASLELDASWMRCLGHFLTHGDRCGVDYVWTYGPLGYFVQYVYDSQLFWWKYAWELSVKAAFAWMLLRWASLLRSNGLRIAFVALLFLFLPGSIDTLYLFCLLLLGLLPLRDARYRTAVRLAAGTLLLAILALTKFTFLLLGAIVWLLVLLTPGLSWRRRLALAVGYPLALALVWKLLGQELSNFPHFLSSSWEVARGYGGAMFVEGDAQTVQMALLAGGFFLLLIAVQPFSQLRRRENLLGFVLLSAALFLVWKHGFIRQYTHTPYYFGFLLLVPFALQGLMGEEIHRKRIRAALTFTVISLCLIAGGPLPRPLPWLTRLLANGSHLFRPDRLNETLKQREKALAEEWALPKIRRLTGEESVDLMTYSQGILFLNRLNYRPRPIFQSYSAYTPDLLERNAAFYRSERAPAFILLRWYPIDERFPALEDGAALLEILSRYRLVAEENGFLLLKRCTDEENRNAVDHPLLLQRTAAFDEEIRLDELDAAPKLLSIRIDDSLHGRIRKALFRPPTLLLEVNTTDGRTYSYRLISGMAETGFLVDPLLRDHDDLAALFRSRALPRVRSLAVHVAPENRDCFRAPFMLTVWKHERLLGTISLRK